MRTGLIAVCVLCAPLLFCRALDKVFTADQNTLSLWVFDAGSGDKVANKALPDVVGEFSGGVKWVRDDVGTGLEFDGEDGQLNVVKVSKGKFITVDPDSPFTMDFLVRIPKDSAMVGSIYWSTPNVQVEYRGKFFTIWSTFRDLTANRYIEMRGKAPLNDGLPHRITIVRDVANGKLLQYIDGKLDAEAACPGSATLRIPHYAAIGGEISEVANYTRRSENFKGVVYAIHISKIARIPEAAGK